MSVPHKRPDNVYEPRMYLVGWFAKSSGKAVFRSNMMHRVTHKYVRSMVEEELLHAARFGFLMERRFHNRGNICNGSCFAEFKMCDSLDSVVKVMHGRHALSMNYVGGFYTIIRRYY